MACIGQNFSEKLTTKSYGNKQSDSNVVITQQQEMGWIFSGSRGLLCIYRPDSQTFIKTNRWFAKLQPKKQSMALDWRKTKVCLIWENKLHNSSVLNTLPNWEKIHRACVGRLACRLRRHKRARRNLCSIRSNCNLSRPGNRISISRIKVVGRSVGAGTIHIFYSPETSTLGNQ